MHANSKWYKSCDVKIIIAISKNPEFLQKFNLPFSHQAPPPLPKKSPSIPFHKITEKRLSIIQVDNARDLEVVMPTYNLIEYSNNYQELFKTS